MTLLIVIYTTAVAYLTFCIVRSFYKPKKPNSS